MTLINTFLIAYLACGILLTQWAFTKSGTYDAIDLIVQNAMRQVRRKQKLTNAVLELAEIYLRKSIIAIFVIIGVVAWPAM